MGVKAEGILRVYAYEQEETQYGVGKKILHLSSSDFLSFHDFFGFFFQFKFFPYSNLRQMCVTHSNNAWTIILFPNLFLFFFQS